MLEFLLPSARTIPAIRRSVVLLNMPMDKRVVTQFFRACIPAPFLEEGTAGDDEGTTAGAAAVLKAPAANCLCADGAANRLYDLVRCVCTSFAAHDAPR